MVKPFLINDETVNRYGFRILTSGIQTDEFQMNPLMLKDHEDDVEDVVGRWDNIRVNGSEMLADPVFDMEDEESAKLAGKVNRGFIKCCSVGVMPLETSNDPALMLPGQTLPTVTKCVLLEVSIVAKGANKNARIQLMDQSGKRINMTDAGQLLKLKEGISNLNPINNMKINELLQLKADAGADEQAIAIQAIINARDIAEAEVQVLKDKENDRLKREKETQDAEAIRLTDAAIKDGRINADKKDVYLKLFAGDFNSAREALEAIPVRKPVTEQLQDMTPNPNELAELTKLSFTELDRQDKLGIVRAKYPDLYKEKYAEWQKRK